MHMKHLPKPIHCSEHRHWRSLPLASCCKGLCSHFSCTLVCSVATNEEVGMDEYTARYTRYFRQFRVPQGCPFRLDWQTEKSKRKIHPKSCSCAAPVVDKSFSTCWKMTASAACKLHSFRAISCSVTIWFSL